MQNKPNAEVNPTATQFTDVIVRFEKVEGEHLVSVRENEEGIKLARSLGYLDKIPGLEGATVVRLASEEGETPWHFRKEGI